MRWFASLKTITKLAAGFGIVCVLLAVLGVFSVMQLQSVNKSTDEMANQSLPQVKHLGLMASMNADFRIKELQHILSTSDEDMAKREAEMAEIRAKYSVSDEAIGKLLTTDAERKLFEEYNALRGEYYKQSAEVLKLSRGNQNEEARNLLRGKSFEVFYASSKKLQELTDTIDTGCKSLAASAEGTYKSGLQFLGTGTAFGIVVCLVLGFYLARTISHSENALRETLNEVSLIAEGLSSASRQLSAAAQEISSGAQEQASNLEETASSLEQITSTVKQNADNAQQANQLASRSREVAEKGGQVVQNAVNGMHEINAASKQIADIITVIDEIAFQTNLLALNAAVEAARAGEQGRGFAVVAGEVRNLAQRSAGAAKEIKGLIQDSVRKVEAGSALVNQSGDTLQEIVTSVKRVTDIVGEIAAASREQSTGVEQVSRAVAQMDQVTQTNASQTEELSGTAESLAGQAQQLQDLLVRNNTATMPAAAARPAAGSQPIRKLPKIAARKKSPPARSSGASHTPVGSNVESRVENELDLIAAGVGNDGFAEF